MEAADRTDVHAAERALANGAFCFGVELNPTQLSTFRTYITTLLFWRTRLSLTGADNALSIANNHILDSLAVARHVGIGTRVADLGSGAGFPGVPLAIACPRASVTLVESRRKRANFLREVIRRCRLTNSFVAEGRAEDLLPQMVGTFDVVVSRAVWSAADLLRIAALLLQPGGLAIAMKGPKGVSEITSVAGFGEAETTSYTLEGGISRMLLIYRKR